MNGCAQTAHFSPKLIGSACCKWVRPAITVRRCRSASPVTAVSSRRSSASISDNPWRICRTVALSMMSWVVAPQWVQRPASPAARDSPFTSSTTG
jgi:hypothetical protein